ncbi:hypothetical protein CDV31_016858 [Fusarium ambrosium]|uniref:NAD(P)-binding domain-containing protein n=1 Tax=Fusarium ambrosium TaxID=131363 RepID=A0A428S012_9HYPO|nr:hypothetical protein CDV31_016858 [Fusarium ambrosium]
MKVIVVPGSAQTSRSAIRTLLDDSLAPSVVGVHRNLDKAPAEFKEPSRLEAAQGDISDRVSLDFSGCDAVITMTPPRFDGSDFVAFGKQIASNVKQAVKRSGSVKRVVYVSCQGAQYSEGVGEVRTNHNCERILEGLDCDVVLVRNYYFMENWSSALETIRADPLHFYSTLAPLDYSLPMARQNIQIQTLHVHVRHVAGLCSRHQQMLRP